MIIGGSLANISGVDNSDAFLALLKHNAPMVRIFKLSPQSDHFKAAFDWQIIGRAADLVTVAGALWAAYRIFILPILQSNGNQGPGLCLMLHNPGGKPVELFIRKKFNSREEFTEHLVNNFMKVSKESPSEDPIDITLWKEI